MIEHTINHLGQPVGLPLLHWTDPKSPPHEAMPGQFCRLEPLNVELHGTDLFEANKLDPEGRTWTYLPSGPYPDFADYRAWLTQCSDSRDPLFFAIVDLKSGKAAGISSYLRILPSFGSIELGHIHFSNLLSRTPAATESIYLLTRRAFEMGYRRVEWKCDALNAASRAAALRFGFTFEGIFRQASVYKNRTRDTAWFSIIDREWPRLREAFETWLAPANFDSGGNQKIRLSELTRINNLSGSK